MGLHEPMPNPEPSNAPPRPPTYEELAESWSQLNATNNLLRRNLDQMATRLKDAEGVREELQEMKALFLRTAQGQATPNAQTPNLTPSMESQQPSSQPLATPTPVQEFGKARLPDVRIFEKGSHEEYTQWKMQIRTKLSADHLAYPTEFYQAHYVISRTGGLAFLALQAYVQDFTSRNLSPSLSKLWEQLDAFFEDPSIKQKALQYLRTTKQGKGEFLFHVRAFNLKFNEAGFGQDDDALKIDYLKNSLNRKLLRYQAGYQPPSNETYDAFVHRLRNTWENLKVIDQLSSNAPSYSTSLPTSTPAAVDEMDWTPNVGAMRPRTRNEYWGTQSQIAQRKEEGSCLRCGIHGHLVRQCKAAVPKRTRKPETVTKVLAATLKDESSDEGKEEP